MRTGGSSRTTPSRSRPLKLDLQTRPPPSCTRPLRTKPWDSADPSALSPGEIDPAVSAEGGKFGGAATAWWQSHRGTFTCDGERHVARFSVDTVEPGSRGQLRKGWGYVQFCIITDEGLSAVRQQWSKVKVKRVSSERDDDDNHDDERDDD